MTAHSVCQSFPPGTSRRTTCCVHSGGSTINISVVLVVRSIRTESSSTGMHRNFNDGCHDEHGWRGFCRQKRFDLAIAVGATWRRDAGALTHGRLRPWTMWFSRDLPLRHDKDVNDLAEEFQLRNFTIGTCRCTKQRACQQRCPQSATLEPPRASTRSRPWAPVVAQHRAC